MITYNDILAATPNVLKRLRDLADLPNHGTVAGQAVASLFYEELNIGVSGPINDVDIFVSLTLPPEQRGVVHTGNHKGMKSNRTSSNITSMTVETDDYSQVKFICARSNVTIFRTYQHGLRNFTLIKHDGVGDDGAQTLEVSQDIVNGFDLNLVGVGIHLNSKKPVVSQDFLAFLNHKTIKVLTCNTPTHTLIRLAKKVYSGEIVGASCNYDEQRGMLETYLTLVDNNTNLLLHNGGTVLKVGEKYRALANAYAQYLPPLKNDASSTLYTFNPQSLRADPIMAPIEQLLTLNGSSGDQLHFLLAYTFVANFPTVYKMAHHPTSQRWDMLTHAWNASTDMAPGARLSSISEALFHQPLIDPALGMADVDAATFFFSPKMSQEQQANAVQLYQNLTPAEKAIFHHGSRTIKHVQEFSNNANDHVDNFLRAEGVCGLAKISENISAHEAHSLVDKMFEIMHGNEKYTSLIAYQIKLENFINRSPNLFQHYDKPYALLKRLANVSGVDIEQVDEHHSFIITLAYFNNAWCEHWSDTTQAAQALEVFFSEGLWSCKSFFENTWGERAHHIDFVQKALRCLTDQQLFQHEGKILRNILVPHHYDIIRQRLMDCGDQAALLSDMFHVSQYMEQQRAFVPRDDETVRSLWSKLVLDLNTLELGATKHKRKM